MMKRDQTEKPIKKQIKMGKKSQWFKEEIKRKRALIKGMSKRLPVQLLYEPSFKDGLQQIMRDYCRGICSLQEEQTLLCRPCDQSVLASLESYKE